MPNISEQITQLLEAVGGYGDIISTDLSTLSSDVNTLDGEVESAQPDPGNDSKVQPVSGQSASQWMGEDSGAVQRSELQSDCADRNGIDSEW
jgi:hypothetical protein